MFFAKLSLFRPRTRRIYVGEVKDVCARRHGHETQRHNVISSALPTLVIAPILLVYA